MTMPLTFWFEFASTYSYPAAMRVESLALAAGVPLIWRPFLLGPIFAAQGWRDSPFNIYPVKGRYMWRDLERICSGLGLPLRRPTVFPRNGLLAARVACLADGMPWQPAFVRAVYHANFAADREIGDPAVIGAILAELGQPADEILAAAQSQANKDRLRAQADEAARLGLCGAPTFTAGEEIFWGNDRLEDALAWCRRSDDRPSIDAVLDFWFGAPGLDPTARAALQARWFRVDPAFDREIRERFEPLVRAADRGALDHWQATPRGRLALVLLLDQFTRNIYRGTWQAFACDAKAAAVVLAAIAAGLDRGLDPVERMVFYLPLQHAEDAAIQARSVEANQRLLDEVPPPLRETANEVLRYAVDHRDVIARFGRFPHRNACLGRTSTEAEQGYLSEEGRRYGQ